MTVDFHTGLADKLAYACRLLRKAHRSRARVVVTGDAAWIPASNSAKAFWESTLGQIGTEADMGVGGVHFSGGLKLWQEMPLRCF